MAENVQVIMQELVRRSNEDARRLRAIEQRLEALESRINTMENASIDRIKKNNTKYAEIDVSLRSMGDEIVKMENALDKIGRQMPKLARKQDLKEVERMLDLISPIRQEFVTKDEMHEEIEEEVKASVHNPRNR
jgi:hypothetical protein